MRVVCMDGSGMTYTSRRMQSGSRVRGRLEWEHDMETEPLSFAIRQPCPAAQKFETQKSGKKREPIKICALLSGVQNLCFWNHLYRLSGALVS